MTDAIATLVPQLGRALLHFIWQGAAIGLLAAVALQVLRDARPQARYAVACLALLACALMPPATVLVMSWLPVTDLAGPTDVGLLAGATAPQAHDARAPSLIASWSSAFEGALPWIVSAWAAGACTLCLRMTLGVLWIERLRATPQGFAHADWQARLDALALRFGLRRGVALRLVDAMDSPASAGWWRPVVLLPTALLTRLPTDLIEALLAHELAHIRRHDYLVNLFQGVVEALLFYHPITWWLSRRIRIEREHIADQLAVAVTGEPRRLALALAELAEGVDARDRHTPAPHFAQAAHGGHLMSRIETLVRPGRRSASLGGRISFPLIGLTAACLAFYAHAQIATPVASAKPAATAQSTTAAPLSKRDVTVINDGSVHLSTGKTRDAYALIRKGSDSIMMSGSTDDLPVIERARHSLDGDFLWLRRNGKAYVITDAQTLAKVREVWRDSNRIGEQMEALGSQMEVHGDKMEALGRQMEALTPDRETSAAMEAASAQMERLGEKQAELGARQAQIAAEMARGDDATRAKLEAAMDALSEQQDALSRQMDEHSKVIDTEAARMDAQSKPMEALGRQMEEAGKPMEALGKQMDALGDQQEKAVAQAERETFKLISDAMTKGLATPAPGYTTQ